MAKLRSIMGGYGYNVKNRYVFLMVTGKLWVFFSRITVWLRGSTGGYGLRMNYG